MTILRRLPAREAGMYRDLRPFSDSRISYRPPQIEVFSAFPPDLPAVPVTPVGTQGLDFTAGGSLEVDVDFDMAAEADRTRLTGWCMVYDPASAMPTGTYGLITLYDVNQRAFSLRIATAAGPARQGLLGLVDETNGQSIIGIAYWEQAGDHLPGRRWAPVGFSWDGTTDTALAFIFDKVVPFISPNANWATITGALFPGTSSLDFFAIDGTANRLNRHGANAAFWYGFAATEADFREIEANGAWADLTNLATVPVPDVYIKGDNATPVDDGTLGLSVTVNGTVSLTTGVFSNYPDALDSSVHFSRRNTIHYGNESSVDGVFNAYAAAYQYSLGGNFVRRKDGRWRIYANLGTGHTVGDLVYWDSDDSDALVWPRSGRASPGGSLFVTDPAPALQSGTGRTQYTTYIDGLYVQSIFEAQIAAAVTRRIYTRKRADLDSGSWSTPVEISGLGTEQNSLGKGKITKRLSDGSWIMPYYYQNTGSSAHGVGIARSTNQGDTWAHWVVAIALDIGTPIEWEEPWLEYTADGTLVMLVRRDDVQAWFRGTSTDHGATWSSFTEVVPLYGACYVLPYADDMWLTISRLGTGTGTANHGADDSVPAFTMSRDQGVTWTTPVEVGRYAAGTTPALSTYPDLAKLDDGSVLAYIAQEHTSANSRTRAEVCHLDPTFLTSEIP